MDLTLTSNSVDVAMYSTERRNNVNELNQTKALKKKSAACNRDKVSIQLTDGGINIIFNTGMYEMFKSAAETFYRFTDMESGCMKIKV